MESYGRFSKITEDPELLRLLYDSNPTLVFVKDRHGRFVFANKALADVYNVSVDNLIGKTDADFNPEIDEIEHFLVDDLRVMDEQKELFIPQEKVTGPDGSLVWLQTTKRPLIDEDGSCNHLLGVCVDITERINAEERERNLRKRLERYQRLDSLGVMAGGIAHDLNNLLGPLVAYPDLLRMKIADPSILTLLDQMETSTDHAVAMIAKLLTLARRGNYHAEPVAVAECLHAFIKSPAFEHIQSEHPQVALQLSVADELPIVLGSSTHIHQILLNLVKNAFECIQGNGSVSIQAEQTYCERVLDGFEEVAPGDCCVIRVTDTGPGISAAELDRIFEPFYSTKSESGQGTGLGLAMVYGVVKDLGGSIEVLSEQSCDADNRTNSDTSSGTSFIVRIPVSQDTATVKNMPQQDLSGNARILIIDDLEIQRQLGSKILTALGYTVATAPNSGEALGLLNASDDEFDAVITDMQLEQEDGLDVYRNVRQHYPQIPFIIASGYAESSRVDQALDEGVCAFVRKPYTQATLGTALKSALSAT